MEVTDDNLGAFIKEVYIPIIKEQLGSIPSWMQGPPMTPERKKEIEERNALRTQAVISYRELTDEIAKLHAPAGNLGPYWECDGCDSGSYAEGPPEWPCRTAIIIMKQKNINTEIW